MMGFEREKGRKTPVCPLEGARSAENWRGGLVRSYYLCIERKVEIVDHGFIFLFFEMFYTKESKKYLFYKLCKQK